GRTRLIAGMEGPLDLPERYRIDHHAQTAQQAQDMGIAVGLLRIANAIECPELCHAPADRLGLVEPEGRAHILRSLEGSPEQIRLQCVWSDRHEQGLSSGWWRR